MNCVVPTLASDMNHIHLKPSILCVDDSPEMLLICRSILEANGFQVFTARDGKSALEALLQHAVNAAVIDNHMPGMSGVELASRIKAEHGELPIVMFSDSGPRPAPSTLIDLFVNKKEGPKALRDAVRSLLEKSGIV